MTTQTFYVVPTHRWYIERTVWLIAGVVLLVTTSLAALIHPFWVLGNITLALASIMVSLTGFCVVGNILQVFGFTPMLGRSGPTPRNLYFMQTDAWYLERRIYLVVGINLTITGCCRWSTARGGLSSRRSWARRCSSSLRPDSVSWQTVCTGREQSPGCARKRRRSRGARSRPTSLALGVSEKIRTSVRERLTSERDSAHGTFVPILPPAPFPPCQTNEERVREKKHPPHLHLIEAPA